MRLAFRRRETTPDPLEEPVRRYLLTGDEAALDTVVRETRLRLLAAARRIGDPQDAEDAVQAAYLSLVRRRGEPLDAPVFPWLLTAVVRIAYRRKALVRREEAIAKRLALPEAPVAPLAAVVRDEEGARLRREIDRLPAGYRDPVVLHYMHGLTTPEVGRLLDLPDATVRTRLRRARGLLRSRFPAGLVYGLLFLPWIVKDAAQGAGLALSGAAVGGVMGTGGVAAVAVVALGLGALAGAKLFGGTPAPLDSVGGPPGVHDRLQAEKARADAAKAEAARRAELEEKVAKLTAALDETNRKLAGAEERARAAEAAAAAAPKEPEAAKPAGPGAPRFSFGEYDEHLAKVDWSSVGENTRAMVPLIEKLRDSAGKEGPPDLSELGRIQKHNASLIEAASKIAGKIPGRTVNGSFTHPAFMANSIAATLEASGLPLSDAQADALGKVGRDFSDRDRARLAAYDDRAWELQKVLDDADIRDRFFEAAFALLSPEQRKALVPEPVKGLLGFDLFSSGLMLAQHIAPVASKGRDEYAGKVVQGLTNRTGVAEERKEDLKRLVTEWAATLPEEWFDRELPRAVGQPLIPSALVLEVGRRQLALCQRLAQDLGLAEEKAQSFRKAAHILLPLTDKDD